ISAIKPRSVAGCNGRDAATERPQGTQRALYPPTGPGTYSDSVTSRRLNDMRLRLTSHIFVPAVLLIATTARAQGIISSVTLSSPPTVTQGSCGLEQAGNKPESLVHEVTLLPRHAPSWWGQSVTHPLGIRRYLSLKKDNSHTFSVIEPIGGWSDRRARNTR